MLQILGEMVRRERGKGGNVRVAWGCLKDF